MLSSADPASNHWHLNIIYGIQDAPAAHPPATPPPSPAVGLPAPPPLVVPPPAPAQALTPQQRQQQLNQVKLPPSHKITAPMIDDVSHTRKIARRREKWLKGNETVKAALEELSKPENVFQGARFIQEVDDSHKVRSKHRELLRGFEHSGKRLKDLHNQRLRTKRTWSKVAAAERRYVQDHARRNDPCKLILILCSWIRIVQVTRN